MCYQTKLLKNIFGKTIVHLEFLFIIFYSMSKIHKFEINKSLSEC